MEQIELRADRREVLGKKVRFLRRDGIVPLHLYGNGVESMPLQCDVAQLRHVIGRAGKTRLISLKINGEGDTRNVFIREIQRDAMTGGLLHVDLFQVKMGERIRVDVPIILVGEAPALKSRGNTLTQELHTLSIEALPGKVPAGIEIDVSGLTEPEQAIHVRDIAQPEEGTILDDPDHVVVKISLMPTEREEVVEAAVEELVKGEAEEGAGSEAESEEQ